MPKRIINILLLAGIVFFCGEILATAVRKANLRADVRIVAQEAQTLYEAFEAYHERNRVYPAAYLGRSFDTDSLDPLRRRGYYRGTITARLLDTRVDAYDSPDDRGLNQEFWLEMTLQSEPSIRFLVVRSDDAPLGGGKWLDGVFVYRGGQLERL